VRRIPRSAGRRAPVSDGGRVLQRQMGRAFLEAVSKWRREGILAPTSFSTGAFTPPMANFEDPGGQL
jgi:hypothetical protein